MNLICNKMNVICKGINLKSKSCLISIKKKDTNDNKSSNTNQQNTHLQFVFPRLILWNSNSSQRDTSTKRRENPVVFVKTTVAREKKKKEKEKSAEIRDSKGLSAYRLSPLRQHDPQTEEAAVKKQPAEGSRLARTPVTRAYFFRNQGDTARAHAFAVFNNHSASQRFSSKRHRSCFYLGLWAAAAAVVSLAQPPGKAIISPSV